MSGWQNLDVDLDDLLTVAEAATTYQVSEHQIRQWKRRGHLLPAGLTPAGRPMFRGLDVLRAQARAEANAERTQGENLAQRHASRSA